MNRAADLDLRGKFRQAIELHQQGHLGQAEALYRELLAVRPELPEAWLNLALILHQLGRFEEALASFDRTLALQTPNAEILFNRGNVLRRLGRLQDAVTNYDQALALRPGFPEALHNRGNTLVDLDQLPDALTSYDAALNLRPHHPDTLISRGAVLFRLHRREEALESFDRALAIQPAHPDALFNRGILLQELQRPEEALASYEQGLAVRPLSPEAWTSRGHTLLNLGRWSEAVDSFDRALTQKPGRAEILHFRGNALMALNRYCEALESYDQALAVWPDQADTLNNRGMVLHQLKRLDEAIASFNRALSLEPGRADTLCNLGDSLQFLGRIEDAAASYEAALAIDPDYPCLLGSWINIKLRLCSWTGLGAAFYQLASAIEAGKLATAPFPALAMPLALAHQRKCAETYIKNKYPPISTLPISRRRSMDGRLRLAYFSADFYNHATAYLTAGLFAHHNRNKFEVIAFSFGPVVRDSMRAKLEATFDKFIDVREKSDTEIALVAREHGIDIAVDLKGFTQDARTGIFAHRAAPVQVSYLGYPGTMAANYIDYLVADPTLIAEKHIQHYAEKIAYLPHTYQANDGARTIAERQFTRREAGLPDHGFVFCCFNNGWKITPGVFSIWMRLLERVDHSVLWLFEDNPGASRNMRMEAAKLGIAAERLVFAPRMKHAEHLARHRLADLFLDTLPYNAHTTASDALWAGLPVLTRLGDTFAGRVAASLLKAAGLPELVTDTQETYESMALELATNAPRLAAFRQRLAANRLACPLFDTALFARHIEAAYVAMWQRHEAGLQPDHIIVAP